MQQQVMREFIVQQQTAAARTTDLSGNRRSPASFSVPELPVGMFV
jgi:hypothetical protein